MVMGRVREMLKAVPDLHIDVMGPCIDYDGQRQVLTLPEEINPDLWNRFGPAGERRLRYVEHWIEPNALATRYNFDIEYMSGVLGLSQHKADPSKRYDIVFINDPMHLRNFKALFQLKAGYRPKYVVHSHFLDNPSCPKFPTEASLWMGQVEAARKADLNFWQCESALRIFLGEMEQEFQQKVVDEVKEKSFPWDDGYSVDEIRSPIDDSKLRFDKVELAKKVDGKVIIFVPNRIGGRGRSSDYTNCGKFMFEWLPELRKVRQDFVVIAGNPSQKFLNSELEDECGPNGYINIVPDALNRDEFKYVAKMSHIALGLYDQDSYGGTVARECVELGCAPVWPDMFEYAAISREVGGWPFMCRPDFSNILETICDAIHHCKDGDTRQLARWMQNLQRVVRDRCSYEETTWLALYRMGLVK